MSFLSQKREALVASHSVDLLSVHKANPKRYPFLLESVASDAKNNRFDILFAFPQEIMQLTTINQVQSDMPDLSKTHYLKALNQWFQSEYRENDHVSHLPFVGGWFLYLGYELAQEIEPKLKLPMASQSTLPIAYACRVPAAIVVDRTKGETWCVAESEYIHHWDTLVDDAINSQTMESVDLQTFACEILEEVPERYLDSIKKN